MRNSRLDIRKVIFFNTILNAYTKIDQLVLVYLLTTL